MDDKPAAMAKVVEGLRGEANNVAMDIGFETLLDPEKGLKTLIDEMRKMVFPQAAAEAKELYRAGHKIRGVLSRQPGEPMTNYVKRRKRWWSLLKNLDSTVELSTKILGDLCLEASGLSDIQ